MESALNVDSMHRTVLTLSSEKDERRTRGTTTGNEGNDPHRNVYHQQISADADDDDDHGEEPRERWR